MGWTKYEEAEEAKHDAMCFNTAIRNGHSKEEAENCDAGSLGCSDCPFKAQLTLTEMLMEEMLDPYPYPDAVDAVKQIFKKWLKTVGLGGCDSSEAIRQLLITLVDEP